MSEKKALGSQPSTPSEPPPSYETAASIPSIGGPNTNPISLPRPPPLALPVLNQLRSKRVILASASPRRKQIISFLGLRDVEIIPSNTPEDFPKSLSPFEYVLQTATHKAITVYQQQINNPDKGEPALILAADTIVADISTGSILEKPRSEAHHITMLKALRDAGDHKVFTAVAGIVPLESARDPGYALETVVEETNVRFDPDITDELLVAYVKTREGVDKAGGYGMQGLGSILVQRIEGSYDNVIGLPLRATLKLIEKVMSRADDEDLLGDEEEGSDS
ncbi:hypothetical protein UREG_02834 [Uncinocarpus reesii 1704]|uniref:Septum formation protein Maf n=1 Tax=Uncinocarpus reesii (strain UAMH 1704) TaxID=336963 RepID=C4JI88_UNCRE|nr:uncharacterized protein UREG_02834 [Uncinocarpus reesii 1704]EEP77985.1 hypothetical protein UREG_02834 [Uncinocarpus reesii 1704]